MAGVSLKITIKARTQNLARDANQVGQILVIINPSLIKRVDIIAADICLGTTKKQ
jgi:hypothetical protein